MKGVPPSPGLAIKKHQSFFQTLVQTFLCTAYFAPLGKPKAEIGTEYPDLVLCGVLPPALSAKPSPVSPEWPAHLRQTERTSAPSQCRFCVGDFHPVPLYFAPKKRKAVFRNMPIFCFRRISSTEIQLSPFSNHLSRACGINDSFGIIVFFRSPYIVFYCLNMPSFSIHFLQYCVY